MMKNTDRIDNRATTTDKDMFQLLINNFSCHALQPNTKVPSNSGWSAWSFKKNTVKSMEAGSNLGVLMGPASGLMVLDIDKPDIFFAACDEAGWDWSGHQVVQSLKGFHIYFRYDKALHNYFKSARVSSAMDLIGAELLVCNSYAVAPGSVIDGHQYVVHHEGKIARNLPEFVIKALLRTTNKGAEEASRDAALDGQRSRYTLTPRQIFTRCKMEEKLQDGQRNAMCYWFALMLFKYNCGMDHVEEAADLINEHTSHSLSYNEIRNTISRRMLQLIQNETESKCSGDEESQQDF